MKKDAYVMALMALSLLAPACKKSFIDLAPEGHLNDEIFFKSTQDFDQALTGAYQPLRDVADIAFYMDEMRSDNTEYDYNEKDRGGVGYERLADFLDDQNNGVTSARWQGDYTGISRTNVILDRIAHLDTMEESDRNRITGEAKALRAHYYFDLVRHYGGVPLYLHEVTNYGNAFLPRTTVDSIYQQIIADFTDAIQILQPPEFPQTGRITKGMAETELALVQMTRGKFSEAIPLLKDVTTMGYALMDQYADVFDPADKNNQESIFEVQYLAGDQGQQSTFIYYFIPATPNTENILGIVFNNSSHGGWNIPTADLMMAYEPGDKRMDASIGVIEGHYDSNTDFIPDRVLPVSDYAGAPQGEVAKYFIRKYLHPPYEKVFNTTDDWPVYRYAGALLMLAESLNETGNSAQALPYLNEVRHRAGLDPVAVTDQVQLRKIIAHERRIELAFENHRWLDLVRTGQAVKVMTAFGEKMKQIHGYLLPNSYEVTQDRLIYPIPYRELQVNSSLTQNPGY